jgi:hypothetical protein
MWSSTVGVAATMCEPLQVGKRGHRDSVGFEDFFSARIKNASVAGLVLVLEEISAAILSNAHVVNNSFLNRRR